MKLIFLHGPPAAGKFTIAKELETLIGCSVFHNHLTIDAAKPFFEFGTESFWKLVRELRLSCLKAGAKDSTGTVVYTSCYDHPTDLKQFEEIEQIVVQQDSKLLPVYLKCETLELEKRVANPSRVAMGKVRSVEGLRSKLNEWNCVAVPRENCVTILTDGKSALQCAQEIVSVFELGR
jgi:hypothetical protein